MTALDMCDPDTDTEPMLDVQRLSVEHRDVMLSILECFSDHDLCSFACVAKDMTTLAHDDALWLPIMLRLPAKWTSATNPRFAHEGPWAYTLRVRRCLLSPSVWSRLEDHRRGCCPYLAELGTVAAGTFQPAAKLHAHGACHVKYGAVCELVQLEAAREGSLSHRTYRAVAEEIMRLSADAKTATPADTHMVVREIYKNCYAGFGMASGAASAGMGFGESGTLANVIARKGVVRRVSREGMSTSRPKDGASSPRSPAGNKGWIGGSGRGVADEELRKRLETKHNFMSLVPAS